MTILQDRQQKILQRGATHLRTASRELRSACSPQLEETEVVQHVSRALDEVAEAHRIVSGEPLLVTRGGIGGNLSWHMRHGVLSEAASFIDTLAVHLDHAKFESLLKGYRLALRDCIQPGQDMGASAALIGRSFTPSGVVALPDSPVALRQAN